MDFNIFKELVDIGFKPFPIYWDAENKTATSHVVKHGEITDENYSQTTIEKWVKEIGQANGIAIKLFPPFLMIDFDIKNTENKSVFKDWMQVLKATNEDVLRKVCIEETRNKGYHVYLKYPEVKHKITIAASEKGAEVISVYTGGLVAYCSPTPGYTMIHNSWDDIEELTQEEFDLLVSISATFNEYKDNYEKKEVGFKPVEYPIDYEATCLSFDYHITDEAFETLLNSMDLFRNNSYKYHKKDKHIAYLRKGSTATYSAKVYWQSRKILLFTTSLPLFPTWADNKGTGDKSWVLTPSRVIYYRNKRDWVATIEEIQMICDSIGIELKQKPIELQPLRQDRMQFPYDIFPDYLQEYIKCHNIQHEYIASFMFSALATAIGNTCYLEALDGYFVKPIIYLAVVANAGSAKSPSMKIAFDFLFKMDNETFKTYKTKKASYLEEKAIFDKDKKANTPPTIPVLSQNIIQDATIETVINVLQYNNKGCVLMADELIGFIKRMNAYKQGDDLQKWLEMWDGSSIMLQRITREETKIIDYTCNVVGGIQPGVLDQLSSGDNAYNGFYHRFLFSYPNPQEKASFEQIYKPTHLKERVTTLFENIYLHRDNDTKTHYTMSTDALNLYKRWHDHKNTYYNKANNDNVKGIIAKYQGYCLRFALIIQAIEDSSYRVGLIGQDSMERAIRLTEYFFANMNKALKLLNPETPIDTLRSPYDKIYEELPDFFTMKTGILIADKYKVKTSAFKMFILRQKDLFKKGTDLGSYEKIL
jgi:hypothetical protein